MKFRLGILFAVFVMAAGTPTALATTSRTPFTGTSTYTSEVDPGSTTLVGSILSVRDMIWIYTDAGSPYIAGPDTVVVNYDLDLATGSGELWGTDRIEPTAFPEGAFDCVWHGTFVGYVWTGKVVCHGEGSLDRWQLRGDLGPGNDALAFSGYVFSPGQ